MAKKQKIQPVIITSREAMRVAAADLVADKLALEKLTVKIEARKLQIAREHQEEVDTLLRRIAATEGGLHAWSAIHKEDAEFDGKRSIELPCARFGFRTCPPKVETENKGEAAVNRLASVVVLDPSTDEPIFRGEDYIRYGAPAIDKDAILADRDKIPAEALVAAGIAIKQDELFFFEPKSEVLEASTQEAA
jgi:hypothetical protein